MKNSNTKSIILTVLGLLVLAAGPVCVWLLDLGSRSAPYLCVGLGCGVFGQGLGELLDRRSRKKHPELARQREIEQNDERNVALRDKAQARAFRIMIPVFGALFLAFALMDVELRVVLLLVAAYVYICGCSVYYSGKYRKEM